MSPSGSGPPADLTDADRAVLDCQSDMFAVLDGEGFISYANPATARGLGYQASELVGKHIAELIHPEDLEGAVEAISDLHSGLNVTPAIFRVRRRDDEWMPLELSATSRIATGPFAGRVVVVGRYPGDHVLHMRISEMLIEGAPIGDVIELIPELARWRHPERSYLVLYEDLDGNPTHSGSDVLAEIVHDHSDESTPWARAAAARALVECEPDELCEPLRRAATAAGLASCRAMPVPDPLHGGSAIILEWAPIGGSALSVHRYSVGQMSKALALVMHWRRHIAELERAARSDGLTGLGNRASFFDKLDASLSDGQAGARSTEPGASREEIVGVLYVDLDRFKTVNDAYGHGTGDEVLAEVARRMSRVLREHDVLARLGGDEFAVLCVGLHTADELTAVADRLLGALNATPIDVEGRSVSIGASIGIAFAPKTAIPAGSDALLELADGAMYEAKTAGRNQWVIARAP
jgi:diguanylate cyclase (GGDEF)-like protein/PAS domain S-box-containing protein